jgi:hypothetical protein
LAARLRTTLHGARGDDRDGEDAQRQPAQHHIEGAGYLLREIVSVHRVAGPGGTVKPRGQRDAQHDARSAEHEENSAQS